MDLNFNKIKSKMIRVLKNEKIIDGISNYRKLISNKI